MANRAPECLGPIVSPAAPCETAHPPTVISDKCSDNLRRLQGVARKSARTGADRAVGRQPSVATTRASGYNKASCGGCRLDAAGRGAPGARRPALERIPTMALSPVPRELQGLRAAVLGSTSGI